jgi:4-amino-4-deoxy-L-arabinose transferase-like glycosyltransferase
VTLGGAPAAGPLLAAPGGAEAVGRATSRRRSVIVTLAVVIVLAAVVRVAVLSGHEPVVRNDTTGFRGPTYEVLSYRHLALGILRGDLGDDLGTRTPGYPAFLALCFRLFGVDEWRAVAMVQALLAVPLFLAAYWLWSQVHGGPAAAVAGAATAVLEPAIVLCENSMQSETLSIVLLVLALPLALHAARRASPWTATGAGLAVAGLALTRPAFQFLVPWLAAYLLLALGARRRTWPGVLAVLAFVLTAAGPLLAWSAFNHHRFGYFTPMTTQGYILTSHTAALIGGRPERYGADADVAAIVDRYARETGWGIWLAYPEIMGARQVSFVEGSRLAERLSVAIIRDRPAQYARSVYRAFLRFWEPALAVGERWRNRLAAELAAEAYGALHRLGCLLFFVVLAADVARPRTWRRPPVRERLLVLAIVLTVCLASTVPIGVENSRYKIPLLPLLWGVVATSLVTNAGRLRALVAGWR